MVNLKLKKNILEIVDNQLKANDPPCTRVVFEKLQNAGYSIEEAKEKIGAIVIKEIYDALKEGKTFNAEAYQNALEEMLIQCTDMEDDHEIRTEWDEWDDLVKNGYEFLDKNDLNNAMHCWDEAWKLYQDLVAKLPERISFMQLVAEQDYSYETDQWIEDYQSKLAECSRWEDRLAFCKKMLDMFDYTDDPNDWFLKLAIGQTLYELDHKEEAYAYFERWIREESQNNYAILGYVHMLLNDDKKEKAYQVLYRTVYGVSCYYDNADLFQTAKLLADEIGKKADSQWYAEQIDKYYDVQNSYDEELDMFGDPIGVQKTVPVVKPDKIYPNAPCPCGSGKKYKKCCGKR